MTRVQPQWSPQRPIHRLLGDRPGRRSRPLDHPRGRRARLSASRAITSSTGIRCGRPTARGSTSAARAAAHGDLAHPDEGEHGRSARRAGVGPHAGRVPGAPELLAQRQAPGLLPDAQHRPPGDGSLRPGQPKASQRAEERSCRARRGPRGRRSRRTASGWPSTRPSRRSTCSWSAPTAAGLRQLTNGPHRNRGPRWSPDGKRLAYFSTPHRRLGDLEHGPDGSDARQSLRWADRTSPGRCGRRTAGGWPSPSSASTPS